MNDTATSAYEYNCCQYDCNACHHRFEAVMTFRKDGPLPHGDNDRFVDSLAGYPEQQPRCPACHSHDTIQVTIHAMD